MPTLETLTEHNETLNEVFDALSHEYRRRVLYRLVEEDAALSTEFDSTPALGEQTDPDILGLQLYHLHLPKLDEAEFIDWDRDEGSIRRGERFEAVVPLLELLSEQSEQRM